MNKKGFTLIELLGVIVILAVIGMLATPIVQGSLDNGKTKACQMQVDSFKKATKNYLSSNPFANISSVTINELINKGYIEENTLDNPKGGKFSKNSKINITYQNGKATYEYVKDSGETACED